MKTKSKVLMIVILVLVVLLLFFAASITWAPRVKRAVRKSELDGDYILCTWARVTGFEWYVESGYEGSRNEYCNIVGPSPLTELDLKYDFLIEGNVYVFYVEERREYYSDVLGETVPEYLVSGWDILWPVRHGPLFERLKSPGYILQSDLLR